MLRRTVLTDNGFPKCSRAHVVISMTEWCRFFMQCRLRDRRSRPFNVGFRPCPLRAEISPDSLYLLMILWTVDGEIPRFFAIVRWETLFLNCWTISCSLIKPFTYGMFQTGVFLEHSWTFPVFFYLCPNFFGTCCWHQIQNLYIFTQKQ